MSNRIITTFVNKWTLGIINDIYYLRGPLIIPQNDHITSIKAPFEFPAHINRVFFIWTNTTPSDYRGRGTITGLRKYTMQASSAFSVDSLMGKKSLESKANDLEKEGERKSAFSVAPPLPKREFPPNLCNCQPCQQTTGFTAITQSVTEPARFMSLQSMAGAVTLPTPVYLPKSKCW